MSEEEVKNFDYDMVVLFSTTGVKALKENVPGLEQGDVKVAAFGSATAKAVGDLGYRLDLEAPTAQHPSMTGALKAYLEANNRVK